MSKATLALAFAELARYKLEAELVIESGLPAFELRRVNGKTVIAAPDDAELLYGVYDYAERFCGWSFFEPGRDKFDEKLVKKLPDDGIIFPAVKPRLKRRGFIQEFPNGYDTYIEQGGTNVSGGQKQRLCIARALVKKPKILILDDSTSAVDTRTDALIRAGFKTYIPETTKIIIAQRIASVMEADMILVMDNGRIAQMGTHDELMQTSEIYREVYEQQTNGGEDDE